MMQPFNLKCALTGAFLALAAILTPAALGADGPTSSAKIGPIEITGIWTRATPGGARVGAGYMRITNTGSEPDRLIGGSMVKAGRFEVHEMAMDGDVMRMREIQGGLEIKPGETVELKPGGLHVMFMDLGTGIEKGEVVSGTLVFETAGTVEVTYPASAIGAPAPGADARGNHSSHMGHHGGHGTHRSQ